MKSRKLYALFVVLLLAVWLMTPTLALAQDEIQPEETPTEAPAVEVTEEAPPEVTVEEVQEQLPENTELVILNEIGLEVPLASPEANALLSTGDPVFCPCGYPLGHPACSPAHLLLTDAIDDAYNDSSGCNWGVIFIENGATVGSDDAALVIDADLLPADDNSVFRILGGIDFNPANSTYGTTIGTSTLNQPLTLRDLNGGIGSFNMYNMIIAPPATAATNALNIINADNTELYGCTINDISGHNGLNLNNSDGVSTTGITITDTGDGSAVIIQNESDSFYFNSTTVTESGTGNGISVIGLSSGQLEGGTVTEADGGHGINLDGVENVTTGGITVNESGTGSGIRIIDSSGVVVNWPIVNESGDDNGIVINNSQGVVVDSITINEANGGAGALVTNGSTNVDFINGVIDEAGVGNGLSIIGSDDVTTSATNVDEADDGHGFSVDSSTNVYAEYQDVEEYGDGAAYRVQNGSSIITFLAPYAYENDAGNGMALVDSSNITINGYGGIDEFGANNGLNVNNVTNFTVDGLYLFSHDNGDAVLIQNSNTIDLNGMYSYTGTNASGFYFTSNMGPLSITNSEVDYNTGYGIYITGQSGDMLLDGLFIYHNGNSGIVVNGSIGNFSLLDSTVLDNGQSGTGEGINVNISGNATLDDVISEFNEDANAYLSTSGDILVDNSIFYESSSGSGLVAYGGGTFATSNSHFEWNCMYGLDVGVAGDINVTGAMVYYNNWCGGAHGAELNSDSDITVSYSEFNHNYSGAGLVAFGGGLTTSVSHSTANGNGWDGFALFGNTAVSALGLTAMDNSLSGIYVNNPPSVPVSIFASKMYNNGEYGIDYTTSSGTLKLCGDYYSGNPLGDYGAGAGATVLDYAYYPCADAAAAEAGAGGAGGAGGKGGFVGPVVVEVPFVADFGTGSAQTGDTDFNAVLGLIFQLIDTAEDGTRTLWAQASIPAGLVPDGTAATFLQKAEDELPAELPDGSTFVGPAFTLGFSGLTETAGNMQIKMRLPDGFTVPAGQSLAVLVYDSTGTWVTLPTVVAEGFATAYTDALGTFVLALVTP